MDAPNPQKMFWGVISQNITFPPAPLLSLSLSVSVGPKHVLGEKVEGRQSESTSHANPSLGYLHTPTCTSCAACRQHQRLILLPRRNASNHHIGHTKGKPTADDSRLPLLRARHHRDARHTTCACEGLHTHTHTRARRERERMGLQSRRHPRPPAASSRRRPSTVPSSPLRGPLRASTQRLRAHTTRDMCAEEWERLQRKRGGVCGLPHASASGRGAFGLLGARVVRPPEDGRRQGAMAGRRAHSAGNAWPERESDGGECPSPQE